MQNTIVRDWLGQEINVGDTCVIAFHQSSSSCLRLVNVLSGGMVIDVCEFSSEDLAQKCADEYQDAGFKVQFVVKEM